MAGKSISSTADAIDGAQLLADRVHDHYDKAVQAICNAQAVNELMFRVGDQDDVGEELQNGSMTIANCLESAREAMDRLYASARRGAK